MSAERIATELDDRFRLLTGGARTVLARQQTLAASVDWSHDLLDEAEQITFRRLGVFAGPFPLGGRRGTWSPPSAASSTAEVFDLVSRLVDKSLVVADEGRRGEPRYRLLETLRAYAIDRARAAGELDRPSRRPRLLVGELAPTPRRHARRRCPRGDLGVPRQPEGRASIGASTVPSSASRLLSGVARAWDEFGRAGDAMAAADRLLTDANADLDADAWLTAAWRTSNLVFDARGPAEAVVLLERIEAVAARRGDEFYRRLARWPSDFPIHDLAWRKMVDEQR